MRPLNSQGFVTAWLISGPIEMPFHRSNNRNNQIEFEQDLRAALAEEEFVSMSSNYILGNNSELGVPWRYFYSYDNWFVDVSTFYRIPQKVELQTVCCIYSQKDREVQATVWTYAALDIQINKQHICSIKQPVYKPIQSKTLNIKLSAGSNIIEVRMLNLGLRDTRNLFGFQLHDDSNELLQYLPNQQTSEEYFTIADWLDEINITNGKLIFNGSAPEGTFMKAGDEIIHLEKTNVKLLNNSWKTLEISVPVENGLLSRNLDIIENIKPEFIDLKLPTETGIFKEIADKDNMIFNILAKCALGHFEKADKKNILYTLSLIENRIDTADFLLTALFRLLNEYEYELDLQLIARIKEVLLKFRYWMDEKGSDGMCFWSENHSLMFFSAAMFAGQRYPTDLFSLSGKTGKEIQMVAKERCLEWLTDVEINGFEEYNSSGYMVVTFCALLNIVDYGDVDICVRASSLADRLLENLALHSFNGSAIAPQARVYHDVIYPFQQGTQALINYIDPEQPYRYQHWLSLTAGTKYKAPEHLKKLMKNSVDTEYLSGNARIIIKKTADYILTSTQSEKSDAENRRWPNILNNTDAANRSLLYVKSMNECYHGTTYFRPGVYGYQQHLWYAALDNDCVVFANHPGGTSTASSMRPGYWYGNGVLPAVKQKSKILGTIFNIPDCHPISFVHLFWPEPKFDFTESDGQWLWARKAHGYIGIWCNHSLEKYNDRLFDCEYRVYKKKTAFIVKCSSEKESGNFDNFKNECLNLKPLFDSDRLLLTTTEGFKLIFKGSEDLTQYI
ncbi:MAG: hypothetical protein OCD02_23305 [Spirochaetaceae bacterium]